MSIVESAKKYSELGFHLVSMKSGSKAPTTPNWQERGIDITKLSETNNIGLIHNLSSTCSIDIDNRKDAIKIFSEYLKIDPVEMKKTYPCWRGKKNGIKFLFKMPNITHVGIKQLTYKKRDDVITVFELRGSTTGTGVQDILPPSLHPSGIRYEWINPPPKNYDLIPELPKRLVELWLNWDVEEKAMLSCLGYFKPEQVQRVLEPDVDSLGIIDSFNQKHTVHDILLRNSYSKRGENRYLSPHSTTKVPGLVLLKDGTIYSHHAGDLLGDGKSHDAFDVARILEANGDWKTAFNNARSDLGLELVTYKKPIDVRAFKFFHASEAIEQATPPKWVIKDICEEDSLIGIFGSPKSGKSFIAVDMACCVATGKEWHEHKVNDGLVLYLAGEGHRGLSRRLLAWEQVNNMKLKDSKLHYSERGVQILDDLDVQMMRDEALTLCDTYAQKPKLVIIDTLARNFGAGNENSTEDMNRFVAHVDRFIREEFRCAIMLVHHTGHLAGNRGRGSSVLPAALDWEYKIEKIGNDIDWYMNLSQTLVKDGRPLSPMRFRFNETTLHQLIDDDGVATTSGALIREKYIAEADEKLGEIQEIVLNAINTIYAEKVSNIREDEGDPRKVFVTAQEILAATKEDMTKDARSTAKISLIRKKLIIREGKEFFPKDRETATF